jgi:hypothetical protein
LTVRCIPLTASDVLSTFGQWVELMSMFFKL